MNFYVLLFLITIPWAVLLWFILGVNVFTVNCIIIYTYTSCNVTCAGNATFSIDEKSAMNTFLST